MMTTGSPEASLLATCGSDPIDLAPPFGGRQGTRPKMSPADFATCCIFSIALVVRLFCCAGLAGSTAATLPAPVAPAGWVAAALAFSGLASSGLAFSGLASPGLAPSGLALSDLALSDLAESDLAGSDLAPLANAACWAGWAACARAGAIDAGVSSISAAIAVAATDVVLQKGR